MGLLSFFKDAGEKLFGKGQAQAAQDGTRYVRVFPLIAQVHPR